MGIIYQVKLRCLKVKNLKEVDLTPFPKNNLELEEESEDEVQYLSKAKINCEEKYNEIYINGSYKGDMAVINYPIHPQANVVAFTCTACDEYGPSYIRVYFISKKGRKKKCKINKVLTHSTNFSRFMLKVPEMKGERPQQLVYITGFPLKSVTNLKHYDGSPIFKNKDGNKFLVSPKEKACLIGRLQRMVKLFERNIKHI